MRILPMGERAVLAEVASLAEVLALHDRLAATRPDGVVDLIPAARTVLVVVDPRRLPLPTARAWLAGESLDEAPPSRGAGPFVELDIAYDGPDLAETAALLGITADELARRHADIEWTVAFTGFAPGFGYLVSEEWPFEVPRLATPRTRVPAGAVGLAASFAGAYPRETPGGWRLIGTTSAELFDPAAASPALLTPGARVRFRAVPGHAPGSAEHTRAAGQAAQTHTTAPAAQTHAPVPAAHTQAAAQTAQTHAPEPAHIHPRTGDSRPSQPVRRVRVVEPGLLATVQDLGRGGNAAIGVAPSGAIDRAALRTANRLVGNRADAAAIEITMGGLRAVAEADVWIAVTGAWGPVLLDGREIDPYTAHAWPAGAELHVDWFAHGARAYLAVRGGWDAPAVLGSRSTDLLAGLGPAPLAAGDLLGVGAEPPTPVPVSEIAPWGAPHDDELELELAPGPRADWFAASALDTLFTADWTVSNDADRVGVRLDGPELPRTHAGELPSEGMVPGALQVPPAGRPVVLGPDGPVTGGYPVIAVATDAALDLLGQARPGTQVRFRHARA